MSHYLLTAAGPDRPGIVAAVTKILYSLGCNLEDSAMTRLRGEFAVLLIFSAPAKTKLSTLTSRLKLLETSHRLTVNVKPMAPREVASPGIPGSLCLITVYGADRPGIVYRVTDLLAKHKINVTDLSTHRTEPTGRSKKPTRAAGYILYIEGQAPLRLSMSRLEGTLQKLGRSLGVTVSVKPVSPAAL